jgi:hypothetical protein
MKLTINKMIILNEHLLSLELKRKGIEWTDQSVE